MLRLLIVDDEKNTREGIAQSIDWAAMGIQVSAIASNGFEALQLAEQLEPQLVITDVRMPKMDGLTLAKKLREKNHDIRIIFISGYTDLDYLKSAFKYEAVDYLLKPIDVAELEQVVGRVLESHTRQRQEEDRRLDMEQRLLQSMPYLREKFFRCLVCGEIRNRMEIEDRFDFLGISLPLDSLYTVLMLSVDDVSAVFNMQSQHDRQLLSFSIQNVAQEILNGFTQGYVFEWSAKEFVCVLVLPEDEALVEKCIDDVSRELHESLNHYMMLRNTIGVGRWVRGIWALSQSFRFAQNALSRQFVLGGNRIIYVDSNAADTQELFLLPQTFYEQLTSAILNGDADHAAQLLRATFKMLLETAGTDALYARNVCLLIASCIVSAAGRIEVRSRSTTAMISRLHQEVIQRNTLESILELFLETTLAVCLELTAGQKSKKSDLIYAIQSLIQKEFQENLTITNIAKRVYLSPTYICLLFKQETGQPINGYLTSVRMEAAKKLLRTGKHKVLDVAISVGYHDQKYFCKLFKKIVGVNPSEYR